MARGGGRSRRRWLRHCVGAGVAAAAGCLRLTDSSDSGSGSGSGSGPGDAGSGSGEDQSEPSTATGSSEPVGDFDVTLGPMWSMATSQVTTADGDFFVQPGFEGLARVQPDGETVFETGLTTDQRFLSLGTGYREALDTDGSSVYVGARASDGGGARLHALDADTGEQRWTHDEPADGRHDTIRAVTATGDLVIAASQSDGSGDEQEPIVRGLDAETGTERWQIRPEEGFVQETIIYEDQLLVAQTFDLRTYSLDTQAERATRSLWIGFAAPVRRGDVLFAPGETVRAVDLDSGEDLWATETGREINATPGVGDSGVFVGSQGGFVLGYDRDTGEQLWESRVPGVVDHPVLVEDGVVWVATERGDLSAFAEETGELVYEGQVASDFGFAIADGVLKDDERENAFEIRRT